MEISPISEETPPPGFTEITEDTTTPSSISQLETRLEDLRKEAITLTLSSDLSRQTVSQLNLIKEAMEQITQILKLSHPISSTSVNSRETANVVFKIGLF